MSNLSIVTQETFGAVQCDFWRDEHNNVYMTIAQLAQALEYSSRDAIEKIVNRNIYLRDKEFSVTDNLSATDGKSYDTRIFTEDGIYEVTMLSTKPKAREFRAWVRKILKALRKGEATLTVPTPNKDELKAKHLEVMAHNARIRQAALMVKVAKSGNLSSEAVELLEINAMEYLLGRKIPYRPRIEQKHYSMSEIAAEAGVSPITAGKLAKGLKLKQQGDKYGFYVLDKSPYSSKQVEAFRYNERGRIAILDALANREGVV